MAEAEGKTALQLLRQERRRQRQLGVRKRTRYEVRSYDSESSDLTASNGVVEKDPSGLPLLLFPSLSLLQQGGPAPQSKCQSSLFPFDNLGLGITEISGEAGSGKTQLCLGLCVSCVTASNASYDSRDNFYIGNKVSDKKSPSERKNRPQNPHEDKWKIDNYPTSPLPISNINGVSSMRTRHFEALYITLGDEGGNASQLSLRLDQMIRARTAGASVSTNDRASTTTTTPSSLLSRILIRHVRNLEEFRDLIVEIPTMLQQHEKNAEHQQRDDANAISNTSSSWAKVGLIVMDSITGLFRLWEEQRHSPTSFRGKSISSDRTYYSKRSSELFHIASRLKCISDTFAVPVVVVNQVSTTSRGDGNQQHITVPALGLSWSNCVNTRILLSRREIATNESAPTLFERRINVLLSSSVSLERCEFDANGRKFKIDSSGLSIL